MSVLFISGCCAGVDCSNYGGSIELRLLKNGAAAIGSSGPLTDPHAITFYPDGFEFLTQPILFFADTQSISLLLDADDNYILVLDEYGIDTVTVTPERVGKGSCGCNEYRITSVVYDGEVICTDVCDEVIDVEI